MLWSCLIISCCCAQIGLEELHRATYLEMLSQIAREPAFDTLRTKQQLGMCLLSKPTTDRAGSPTV